MGTAVHEAAAREFEAQRHFLWGFCYRMTGDAVDADALVSASFVRALERPPADSQAGWQSALARSAATEAIDAVRLRQRRSYAGPWLPAPIDTGSACSESETELSGPSFDDVESVTPAFLLALERLSPRERAVLTFRSVYGYDVGETARALDLTYGTVKATLLRAQESMAEYLDTRRRPTRREQARVAGVLHEFLDRLQAYDVAGMEAMLVPRACWLTDSGGEFVAPTAPVEGRDRVVRLLVKMTERRGVPARDAFRMLNGLPALVADAPAPTGWASRYVFQIEAGPDGLISDLRTISASRKLAAIGVDPA
jgi:RNA polymerase sigma-70 factor (ECF subfamily)